MTEAANADQTAFWNAEPGRLWVSRAADFDAILAGVSGLLLDACAPAPGESILDIGCGSGTTTLAFGAAVGPAGRILGVDVSEPLLAHADDRRRAAGLDHVSFRLGDAQTDPLPAGAFDAAISRFGVMFFADPVAAFRNIAAALRPGGRIRFAAWASPEANPWFSVPHRIAADRLGHGAPEAADAPGPMAFADRARVVGLLGAAGLAACGAELHRLDLHHPGGLDAVVDLATDVGPTSRLMLEKAGTAADLAAIRTGLAAAFAGFVTPDGIRIPAEINLFRASRPDPVLAARGDSA